jgi:hypothetical protein
MYPNHCKHINNSRMIMAPIHKIPPNLPLQREELPLFGKEGRGEIFLRSHQFNFAALDNSNGRRIPS